MLIVLEIVEDELELRQAVVEPIRIMLVAAKEELLELFCIETGVSCSGQKKYALLEEMHKHEDCFSSQKIRLPQRLDCPELGLHKVEACD